MRRTFLKSKIHRATVSDADLTYEGSVSIDPKLMEAADLREFEKVEIYNCNNGARFATYVILAKTPKCASTAQPPGTCKRVTWSLSAVTWKSTRMKAATFSLSLFLSTLKTAYK